MRWKKLRRGTNVEHRREGGGGGGIGLKGGIGGIIMALIAIFVFKEDPQQTLSNLIEQKEPQQTRPASAKEAELAEFLERIEGSTEDVWTKLFKSSGKRYTPPKIVNYNGRTSMATGGVADSRMGPFYLPAAQKVYLDVSFFEQMKNELRAGGDFAYAYVIAHEVAHHVQHLTGYTDRVHKKKGRVSEKEYNRLSVRLELQADFLAGVWAHHADEQMRREQGHPLMEDGDIQEAMRAAKAIGDDTLQRQAGRKIVEDSFTHGTSEQRLRWFMKGFNTGDLREMDTFGIPYESL